MLQANIEEFTNKSNGCGYRPATEAARLLGQGGWVSIGGGLAVAMIEVTPEKAKAWLARNFDRNRKVAGKRVERIVRSIQSSRWRVTHQGIAFTPDGKLIDGQHRLYAVIRSGRSIWTVVFFGVPSFEEIDTGQARSVGQIRSMRDGLRSDHKYIAVVGNLWRMDSGDYQASISESELLDLEEMFSDELAWLTSKTIPPRYTAAMCSALAYCYPIDPERVNAFTDAVFSQIGLRKDSPELKWVQYMTSPKLNTAGNKNMKALMQITCGSIRKYLRGPSVTVSFTRPVDEHVEWARAARDQR
jgi:hypothetical protein